MGPQVERKRYLPAGGGPEPVHASVNVTLLLPPEVSPVSEAEPPAGALMVQPDGSAQSVTVPGPAPDPLPTCTLTENVPSAPVPLTVPEALGASLAVGSTVTVMPARLCVPVPVRVTVPVMVPVVGGGPEPVHVSVNATLLLPPEASPV